MMHPIEAQIMGLSDAEWRRENVIGLVTKWIEDHGFTLMDDGTHHHVDWAIRVQFKKRVVRIDQLNPLRYGFLSEAWIRLASAPYSRITFELDGRPRGLGFYSLKGLRELERTNG